MNSIIYDDKIITPKDNKWRYYYLLARKLDKKDCVKFALFSAKMVSDNSKESNDCIGLVEKWLLDEKSVSRDDLHYSVYVTWSAATSAAAYSVANAANAVYDAISVSTFNIDIINKYLQILLRKTKQFQNNKILEQISKTDVDKLELVDWNMITDIMLEEYNVIHEFSYSDIFSRRCLIELLRREYA